MRGRFLLSFLAIILLAQCQESRRCFDQMTLGTSEITFINSIKDSIQNKESFDATCLHILIERGYYKAAILLFEDYFLTNNIDLHESTLKLTQVQKRDLDKFIQKTMSANQAVQQIEPVLKWAQSEDNIFLHIKLSMRADSPACVHCKVEKIEITNSTLLMSAYGIQSHQPLRFYLNLTLYDEINPELSSWNEDSVGTLFFNLTKIHKNQAVQQEEQAINTNLTEDNLNQKSQPSSETGQGQQSEKGEEQQPDDQKKEDELTEGEKETQQDSFQKEEELQQQSETPQENSQNSENTQTEQQKDQNEQDKQNQSASTISTATTTTTSNKKESIADKLWLRLEKTERKKEFAIWWDIRDKYRNAMDEWDSLCAKERENKKKKAKQDKQNSQSQNNQNQQQQQQQQQQQLQQQQEQQEQQQQGDNTQQQQDNTIENKTDL